MRKQLISKPKYSKLLKNDYNNLDFDLQFGRRLTKLTEVFKYTVKNKQLKGLNVIGTGQWIRVKITRKEYKKLSLKSKKQLDRILNSQLYPGRPFRWGQFKHYKALGPRTVRAGSMWGGSQPSRTIRFHI